MKSDPKQPWIRTRAMLVARVFVAALVAVSFLITVAPLGTASSAAGGTMDCCVGKPGHVPGSCATGLLASAKKSQSASPVSYDHDPASASEFSLAVVAGVSAGEHCGLHAQPERSATSTTPGFTGPEAMLTTAEPQSDPLTVEASSVPTAESELTSLHALSQPCRENCGACSTSTTRRPREQSTLSFAARPPIPLVRKFSPKNDLHIRSLNRKWLQLQPRAPPA